MEKGWGILRVDREGKSKKFGVFGKDGMGGEVRVMLIVGE